MNDALVIVGPNTWLNTQTDEIIQATSQKRGLPSIEAEYANRLTQITNEYKHEANDV